MTSGVEISCAEGSEEQPFVLFIILTACLSSNDWREDEIGIGPDLTNHFIFDTKIFIGASNKNEAAGFSLVVILRPWLANRKKLIPLKNFDFSSL